MSSKSLTIGRTDDPAEDAGEKARKKTGKARDKPTVWEQTGGVSGLFISSFPVTVFTLVNSRYGLLAGIGGAVGTAIAFVVLSVVRKRPLRPAVSSFIGIAISSSIAYSTGTAKGYFLFDIWFYLVCFSVTALTIVIRRPLAGVIWSSMNRQPMEWRKDKPSLIGYDIATAAMAAVFAARFVVQRWLYEENYTGWLAFAKITMGYPLTMAAFASVVWAVRRSDKRLKALDAEAEREEEREREEESSDEAEAPAALSPAHASGASRAPGEAT